MDKKILLIKMMEVSGGIRQQQRGKRGDKTEKREHSPEAGHRRGEGRGHKMSPVTQSALCLLAERGSLNQRTMAKSLNVTGQAISDLVKKLETGELISKEPGEHNNENIITLTDQGMAKAQEVNQKLQTMANDLFASFTQEEMDTLATLLEKIKDASGRKETQ